MKPLELAEVMIASWVMGGDPQPIPMTPGWLDRMLHRAIQRGALGEEGNRLRFVDTRIGLQCLEAEGLIEWSQRAQLVGAPGPGQGSAPIRIGPRVARRILREQKIQEEVACRWGQILREASVEIEMELRGFSPSIEEY